MFTTQGMYRAAHSLLLDQAFAGSRAGVWSWRVATTRLSVQAGSAHCPRPGPPGADAPGEALAICLHPFKGKNDEQAPLQPQQEDGHRERCPEREDTPCCRHPSYFISVTKRKVLKN